MIDDPQEEYIKSLEDRISSLESRDARRQEIINQQAERIAELEEDMQDRREGDKRILDDGGYPDEVHCSCVPTLRKRIAELEKLSSNYFAQIQDLMRERDAAVAIPPEIVEMLDEAVESLDAFNACPTENETKEALYDEVNIADSNLLCAITIWWRERKKGE